MSRHEPAAYEEALQRIRARDSGAKSLGLRGWFGPYLDRIPDELAELTSAGRGSRT